MAYRYRNNPPPYELMNPGSMTAPSSGYSGADSSSVEPQAGRSGRWWGRIHQVVVLRIPMGLALVMTATFLLLLVLSYWAGHARGQRQAPTTHRVEGGPYLLRHSQASPTTRGQTGPAAVAAGHQTAPTQGQDETRPSHDVRQVGLNYFVLAHYPEADARRLVDFLAEHGVEAAAYRPHNKSLFQVVALRGFSREEILGPGRQQFEQVLRQLGRLWKSRRFGPDFSQTGIYLDRYENEPVAQTLE